MAKNSKNDSQKVSFGSKRVNKSKRKYGPKEEKPKKYKGQGR
jgi:hypothetical protein